MTGRSLPSRAASCLCCEQRQQEAGASWCSECLDQFFGVNREPMPPLWRAIWALGLAAPIVALLYWVVT